MIVTVYPRKTRPGLCFGSRAQRDIDEATILSDARYMVLLDRDDCVVCGRRLRKDTNLPSTEGVQSGNAFHPACSSNCRRQYLEWLDSK
jgi:hypothetical protein